ncbi:LysM peptidoglycan-binding domain-containing protein [Flammeovirga kamogawensis]|uniref:LysM peptidoglycan-binding domain-containing protein n=1 Tax=Flammeovirga kamogawensis TaxID=373891 RepID=A0ABX8GVE9_9BACT|nr:LysM peptidoglycan-binding domain-containing protein [Flammeovirga kamogawensis]MBB6461572.1 LysM repeat protein [Flammeovirga kamogawensis]QWG07496.1 LysM peptidoglycan-binding domain-containing protein [Flammeovirga kamogawensis]TRX69309.1 LysM peptidoglycan-binding domain-containing protein [Flammeovirga kamogawensis]
MKKTYTIGVLLGLGSILSSFTHNTENNIIATPFAINKTLSPSQSDNPYPIVTNVHTKTVNGEEITLVDANNIPAFIAGANQNLLLVATSLGIDVKKIYKYNDMDAYDDLQEGHVYYLKAKKSKATTAMHTVIEEKNLWEVSQKYGIKLTKLAKKNRMAKDDPLARGRVLFLQKTRPKSVPPTVVDVPPAEDVEVTTPEVTAEVTTTAAVVVAAADSTSLSLDPNSKTHTVQDGESLFTISRMYNVNMLDIKEWNQIGDDLSLEEGQVLIVGTENSEVKPSAAVATTTVVATPQSEAVKEDSFAIMPKGEFTNRGPQTNTAAETFTVGAITVGAAAAITEEEAIEEAPAAPTSYVVQNGDSYYGIARKFSVSPQSLQAWNDNAELHPGESIRVSSPIQNNGAFAVAGNSGIDAKGNFSGEIKTHTVESGETVEKIAQKYGIPSSDIYGFNAARLKGEQPKRGMLLQIPIRSANATPEVVATTNYDQPAVEQVTNDPYSQVAAEKPVSTTTVAVVASTEVIEEPKEEIIVENATTHTVVKGETLFAVSRKTGVYHKDLIKWNNLPSNGAINVGQVLQLTPSDKVESTPTTNVATAAVTTKQTVSQDASVAEYHVVEKGDTLYSVSRKYGASVADIKNFNDMSSNEIKIGQRLRVK